MKLDSEKNLRLLRNCIIIELIESAVNKTYKEDLYQTYANLFELCKKGDFDTVRSQIYSQNGVLTNFSKYILETPEQEISQNYRNLAEHILNMEQFEIAKQGFDITNTSYTQNFEELEDEPEKNHFSNHSTEVMQKSLNELKELFYQHSPHTMSVQQFKSFCERFKTLTYTLGKNKFQQYFDTKAQTIQEMQISYNTANNQKTIYTMDFTLSDSSFQESHLTLQTPASNSGFAQTYFQNLCYSYLEADKYTKLDENSLNSHIISSKMNDFKECYNKLNEMVTNCKITISGNSIFYSSESEIEPTEQALEACNNEPEINLDTEFQI